SERAVAALRRPAGLTSSPGGPGGGRPAAERAAAARLAEAAARRRIERAVSDDRDGDGQSDNPQCQPPTNDEQDEPDDHTGNPELHVRRHRNPLSAEAHLPRAVLNRTTRPHLASLAVTARRPAKSPGGAPRPAPGAVTSCGWPRSAAQPGSPRPGRASCGRRIAGSPAGGDAQPAGSRYA